MAWSQVHRHYRDRFGIETSYRLKNQARICSTTKNPVLRLLYIALALSWSISGFTCCGMRLVRPDEAGDGLSSALPAQNHALLHPPDG